MSAFEKWVVITAVIQTMILLGAFLVALYIGLKQTEISRKQTEISSRQAEISKSVAELPYIVSVQITYNPSHKSIDIVNKGQTNIWLWGIKLGNNPRKVEEEARLITPTGGYRLFRAEHSQDLLELTRQNSVGSGVFEIYLTNLNATKYIVTVVVLAKTADGQTSIRTQTTSIKAQEW